MVRKYTKRSETWLKRKRISNDKKFSKKRGVEKKLYIMKLTDSSIKLFVSSFSIFFIASIYYEEVILFYISLFFILLLVPFLIFHIYRKRVLNTYKTISYLQKMDPFDFEVYITNLFNKLGSNLKTTIGVGDRGIDSVGKNSKGEKIVIQTKKYSDKNTVGGPDIRNFIGSMIQAKVKKGIFVTTGYYTSEAKIAANEVKGEYDVTLVDKDILNNLLIKAYKNK